MDVSVTNSEGLVRTIKVVIGQTELGQRYASRLDEVKDTIQLKGFRRGKVPVNHIKKMFGRSLMGEVVQKAVEEASSKVITDRKERPAFQPKIDLSEDKDEIERVMSGAADLAFSMSFEVLPSPLPFSDSSLLTLPITTLPSRFELQLSDALATRSATFMV